jgi:GR25 family glycosyltransferase involved in LPS biosynthesis
MSNPFDFFDKIIYINLDEREDRKIKIEQEFLKYNIKAERFSAVSLTYEQNQDLIKRGCVFYDETRPEYAPRAKSCTLSHLNVIFRSKLMKYENILVLEDDIVFSENIIEDLSKAIEELKKEKKWDMFYLGCNPLYVKKMTDNLSKSLGVLQTHAYAVNKHFYNTILEHDFKGSPCIDLYYCGLAKENNIYLTTKNLAMQSDGFSDIEGHHVEYNFCTQGKYNNIGNDEL